MSIDRAIGAIYFGQARTGFTVWAPFREWADVHVISPYEQIIPMIKDVLENSN